MKIFVNVKSLSSKKNFLDKREIIISENIVDLETFLTEIAVLEIKNFNEKSSEFFEILTSEMIEDKKNIWKVSFSALNDDKKQDFAKWVSNVLQSFEDWIFVVFQNDKKLESLKEKMEIKENDVFTFVKLTMLAWRMW